MSTVTTNSSINIPVASLAPGAAATTDFHREDRVVWIVSTAIIAVMFLLLQNKYWVPGGDSEVYTSAARSIVLGQGYMFNGQAAKIAPPGWPLVLAAVMKYISPTFLVLKLVTLSCMVAALTVFYRVLRRFAPPMLAGGLIVLTALISHVYSLTYWLHSDALFTLITALMLLIALQINERPAHDFGLLWRGVVLLWLCIIAVLVRWAGVINVIIVSAALLQGQLKPRLDARWLLPMAVIAITFISLFVIRIAMKRFAPSPLPFEATAQIDPASVANDVQLMEGAGGNAQTEMITGTAGRSGYGQRIAGYGTWFSYLLWQPFRLATGVKPIWWLATLIGWVVAVFVIASTIDDSKRRQWLLPATAVYTLALCLNWPHATARYLVPITPLLLLMIVRGGEALRAAANRRWQQTSVQWIRVIGVASVVLCNLALYGEEVRIMHARHFADQYEAGMNKGLVAAADYLRSANAGNWQTCVSPEYINIGKRRMSPTGLRILTMLTGKAMLQLPEKWTRVKSPNDRDFRKLFIAKHQIRFYLEQPTISPWRVGHYRMGWLQKLVTGEPVEDTGAGWRLYMCDGPKTPIAVPLPDNAEFPTRVPGL